MDFSVILIRNHKIIGVYMKKTLLLTKNFFQRHK